MKYLWMSSYFLSQSAEYYNLEAFDYIKNGVVLLGTQFIKKK